MPYLKQQFSIILIIYLTGCDLQKNEAVDNVEQGHNTNNSLPHKEINLHNPKSNLYVWKCAYNYTKTKNLYYSNSILNADSLIKGLNELNENILLQKIYISGDTIYTEVKDSKYLAESIGSTGAELYVADVVLNLTEVSGIRYVNISLQEGSHVQAGIWSKNNFDIYKTIN